MYDVWWLGPISGAVYAFMYSDMFYIQCHHLTKKDVWNEVYMNEWMSDVAQERLKSAPQNPPY
jgi:hypothetical protein